jgi:MFS family permease
VTGAPATPDVFRLTGYLAFWTAGTVSAFGSYVTSLALQVLVVVTLHGTATDVGLVNASRWLPYLLFGLVVGAVVDRRRRKPILVATDLARALSLGAVPALWLLGWLSLPVLMGFVALFGLMTLLNDAATQSFLPRLAPAPLLLAANARLDQGAAVAQTSGPVLAGALVTALGAPLAVLIDAATYLVSAVAIAGIGIAEPKPGPSAGRLNLRQEIGEGLRWIYRHRTLAPLAISTHGWFLCNSMVTTVFAPFVLLRLHLTAFELGLALAAAGGAGLFGSLYSTRLGLRWGAGRVVIACRAAMPVAWAIVALAPAGASHWVTIAALAMGQALYGLAMGAENANEMGYWQAVTPDALQGRMNATRRSINRGMIVVGAPLGGVLADTIGYRPTLWLGIAGFVLVAGYLAVSPFWNVRHDEVA